MALPDGRIQHVKYNADTIHGNVMEVTYEGEAHHPDLHLPPEPAIPAPPPPPLGARFERDAATAPSSVSFDLDDYDGGFISFSDDIKPFIDFGFNRYQDNEMVYDDYDYDFDYDLILDTNTLELFPSPRRQRSLASLLDAPLFREYF